MRFIGLLLFVIGTCCLIWCSRGIASSKRPADVAFAVAAPLAVLAALAGIAIAFVPDFFA